MLTLIFDNTIIMSIRPILIYRIRVYLLFRVLTFFDPFLERARRLIWPLDVFAPFPFPPELYSRKCLVIDLVTLRFLFTLIFAPVVDAILLVCRRGALVSALNTVLVTIKFSPSSLIRNRQISKFTRI